MTGMTAGQVLRAIALSQCIAALAVTGSAQAQQDEGAKPGENKVSESQAKKNEKKHGKRRARHADRDVVSQLRDGELSAAELAQALAMDADRIGATIDRPISSTVAIIKELQKMPPENLREEIIPARWVRRMTTQVTPPEEVRPLGYRSRGLGFGYFWWTWDDPDPRSPFHGAYTYIGSYGQYLTILPAMDMVVAHQLFAGWFGAPEGEVTWEEYMGILNRLSASRSLPRPIP